MSSWEEENFPQVHWFQEKENICYALSIGQAGLPVLLRYPHLYVQFLSCPQVYLERVPGSSTGCIKWHIDFGCCGLLVDEVTLRLSCVEEYGGEITVTMTGIPGQKRVRYAVGKKIKTDNSIRVLQRLKGLWRCWWFIMPLTRPYSLWKLGNYSWMTKSQLCIKQICFPSTISNVTNNIPKTNFETRLG